MGAYKYVQELYRKKQSDVMRYLLRIRCWQYRQMTRLHRAPRPSRPDKARRLGYRAKQGKYCKLWIVKCPLCLNALVSLIFLPKILSCLSIWMLWWQQFCKVVINNDFLSSLDVWNHNVYLNTILLLIFFLIYPSFFFFRLCYFPC